MSWLSFGTWWGSELHVSNGCFPHPLGSNGVLHPNCSVLSDHGLMTEPVLCLLKIPGILPCISWCLCWQRPLLETLESHPAPVESHFLHSQHQAAVLHTEYPSVLLLAMYYNDYQYLSGKGFPIVLETGAVYLLFPATHCLKRTPCSPLSHGAILDVIFMHINFSGEFWFISHLLLFLFLIQRFQQINRWPSLQGLLLWLKR